MAQTTIKLWPDGAPGALGSKATDIPTLTVYAPATNTINGSAIVICPGGGYTGLAAHEGEGYAKWLAKNGITGFVLKYRLGSAGYRHPRMLEDAARAVRLVRARASEWSIDTNRVGIMGSSAGGHLASTLLTHFDSGIADATDSIDKQSSRPDLGILCYPVITMGQYTHQGSKMNLLGKNPSEELVASLSNDLQVTKETPPCFVWHTYEDTTVPVENSFQFCAALRKARVPFEFHIYEKGKHGIGLQGDAEHHHQWADDCLAWLKVRKFVQ
jgi:acetyl esterase/lipase